MSSPRSPNLLAWISPPPPHGVAGVEELRTAPQSQRPVLDAKQRLLLLQVDRITPNPTALRRYVSEKALDSLAESIQRWGQLQPVIVRSRDDHYELICGERRWLAHKRAGLPTIWALEREAVDSESLLLGLVENVQRVGLSHAEKVAALDQLSELSQAEGLRQLARQLRVTPGWLSSQLAVRRDPVIFPALDAGRIGFGQAAEMLRAPASARAELLHRVLSGPGHVPTATIRKWARELRDQHVHGSIRGQARPQAPRDVPADVDSPLERIAGQLERLTSARSPEEREALERIAALAQHLLNATITETRANPCQAGLLRRTTSTDVTCLLCAEQAGEIEETRYFKPRYDGAVHVVDEHLRCGRCGGTLTLGARTERLEY
jgi:ParB/RepB/Spo0J family partition protein